MRLRLGAAVGPSGSSALIHDLSTEGLLFETSADLGADQVDVQLPQFGPARARVVWSHGRFFGCEFAKPIPARSVSAALLQSEPLEGPGPASLLPGPAADAGLQPASANRTRGLAWLKAIGALAVASAGAAYLIATGHLVLLAAIALVVGAVGAVLTLMAMWALDHEIYL